MAQLIFSGFEKILQKSGARHEDTSHNSNRLKWCAMITFALLSACSDESDVLCGNGVLDKGEVCDAKIISYGATCPDGMYLPSGADLGCNADCSLNTDACVPKESPKTCGNDSLDEGEVCDGDTFARSASCPEGTHLPKDAALSCNADCSLNTDACMPNASPKSCGNDSLDEGEVCDGNAFAQNASCPEGTHLPEDADLSCNADCSLNTDACMPNASPESCGNDSLDEGEICDGSQIRETAACPEGMHLPEGKAFACHADCTLDMSACETTIAGTLPQGRRL